MKSSYPLEDARLPAGRADDAHADGLADAEGVADGEREVADPDLVAVGEDEWPQALGLDPQDGEVGLRIGPDQRSLDPVLGAMQLNLDLVGALDDVVVGHDHPVSGHHHTRALAAHARHAAFGLTRARTGFAEETAPHRIVLVEWRDHPPLRYRLAGIHGDHSGGDRLDHRGMGGGFTGAGCSNQQQAGDGQGEEAVHASQDAGPLQTCPADRTRLPMASLHQAHSVPPQQEPSDEQSRPQRRPLGRRHP